MAGSDLQSGLSTSERWGIHERRIAERRETQRLREQELEVRRMDLLRQLNAYFARRHEAEQQMILRLNAATTPEEIEQIKEENERENSDEEFFDTLREFNRVTVMLNNMAFQRREWEREDNANAN